MFVTLITLLVKSTASADSILLTFSYSLTSRSDDGLTVSIENLTSFCWLPFNTLNGADHVENLVELADTLWWFTAAPKPLKIEVFLGSPSPQGSHSPMLGDTTRPGRETCVLVWSKSDRRRLRKTLHKQKNRQTNKQTNKQTNRHYENNGHLAVNQKLQFIHTVNGDGSKPSKIIKKALLTTPASPECQC